MSGDKIPHNCLGYEDDESLRSLHRRDPKKRAARSSAPATESKKRRTVNEPLTAADIPTIVKSVLESLPGPSSGRTTSSDRSMAGGEASTTVTNADAFSTGDNHTASHSSDILR